MKNIKILVLGGRLTPSLVGVLSDPPDVIEFIVSSDTPSREHEARRVLNETLRDRLADSPLPLVRAYDWDHCNQVCNEVVGRYSDPAIRFTFDVTTAPKVMAFAVYEFAKENGHEVIVVDTHNARITSLITQQSWGAEFPAKVSNYLKLFGREYKTGPSLKVDAMSITEEQASATARFFARKVTQYERVLKQLANTRIGAKVQFSSLSDQENDLLVYLQKTGWIKDISRGKDERISCQIAYNPHDKNFISGHWLEMFVRDEAKAQRGVDGQPIFDECMFGFEIPEPGQAPRELDVGCLYRGQLIICSCKFSDWSFHKQNLDELSGTSELVGGKFTSRMFITNALPPEEGADQNRQWEYWKFCDHARQQKIVIVTGEELLEIGDKLAQEAINPTYPRI